MSCDGKTGRSWFVTFRHVAGADIATAEAKSRQRLECARLAGAFERNRKGRVFLARHGSKLFCRTKPKAGASSTHSKRFARIDDLQCVAHGNTLRNLAGTESVYANDRVLTLDMVCSIRWGDVLRASRRQKQSRRVRSNQTIPFDWAGAVRSAGKMPAARWSNVLLASRRQKRSRRVRSNQTIPFNWAGSVRPAGKMPAARWSNVLPASRRQKRSRRVRSNQTIPFDWAGAVRPAGKMPAARWSNVLPASRRQKRITKGALELKQYPSPWLAPFALPAGCRQHVPVLHLLPGARLLMANPRPPISMPQFDCTRTAPDTLLRLRGVKKYFGGVQALKGVDFELQAGEIHALLGENGAGKSTLIKVLGGIHRPDAGAIVINGQPASIYGVGDADRYGIRIIHQELSLAPNLSVAENIYLGREPGRFGFLDRRQIFAEAGQLVNRLGLTEIRDVRADVSTLSVAHQQLVEIARALSCQARILVLDEPTSSLSETETEILFATLSRLREQGVGIIYISHRLEEIIRLANRITVLRDGESIGTQPTSQLHQQELVRWMVGREIADHFHRPAGASGDIVLEVKNLTNAKVRNVSFQLRAGEILGFAGLVGSGRSELARAIFGIDRLESGEILRSGQGRQDCLAGGGVAGRHRLDPGGPKTAGPGRLPVGGL